MIYAIISDIHGNLEALEAVKEEIGRISPDKVVCLGDLVGYGASPNRCIEIAKEISPTIVAGNHDFGAVGLTDIHYFNLYAREAILWTSKRLTLEHTEYLKRLPLTHAEGSTMLMVHATPTDPARWSYIFSYQHALNEFKAFAEQICFVGHSHQACVFEMKDAETVVARSDGIKIVEGRRYIVNVGSIGQPRDGDPRACFCIYDDDKAEIEIRRIKYDVEGAQTRILKAGLPRVLAGRLSWGE